MFSTLFPRKEGQPASASSSAMATDSYSSLRVGFQELATMEDGSSSKQTVPECSKNYIVFSSESSSYLGDLIASNLGIQRGSIVRKIFHGGEKYYRVEMKERYDFVGRDVVYVCSTTTDDELLELTRVGCAFAAYGSRRRIFIIPFLGYSTMERQVQPGEIVTAKVNARIMSCIPNSKLGNIFLFMDLHVQSLLQYLEGPAVRMELYAEHVLLNSIRQEIDLSQPYVFASADLGRPLWVESFAKKFNVGVAFVRKSRSMEETKVVGDVVGVVRDKHVIIYDDMTRSGGTLIKAAEAYLKEGATKVSAVLSHLALASEEVVMKLVNSPISVVIATNTHPMSQHPAVLAAKDKFRVVDVSPIFSDAVLRLMSE